MHLSSDFIEWYLVSVVLYYTVPQLVTEVGYEPTPPEIGEKNASTEEDTLAIWYYTNKHLSIHQLRPVLTERELPGYVPQD